MKKIVKYLLHVALAVTVYILVRVAMIELFDAVYRVAEPTIPNMSYVARIDTPKLNSKKVKKMLDKFNEMGYSEIVTYDEKLIPIWIIEKDRIDLFIEGDTLAIAASSLFGCPIWLNVEELKGNDKVLERTLIHEYLHCMTYDHSFITGDLMDTHDVEISEENVQEWADRLRKRMRDGRR